MRDNDKRLERTKDGERSTDPQIFMSQRSDEDGTDVQAGGRKACTAECRGGEEWRGDGAV